MLHDRELGVAILHSTNGNRWQVQSPYSADFVLGAHQLEGRWRKRSQCWTFPSHNYSKMVALCNTVYGTKFKVPS